VGNSVPSVWEVTSPKLAIVRMHGRNHETWNRKGLKAASDRFNYDYSERSSARSRRTSPSWRRPFRSCTPS
jgi:hypothetical protein